MVDEEAKESEIDKRVQEHISKKTVVGQAAVDDKGKGRNWVALLAIALTVVGIAVGVSVGVTQANQSSPSVMFFVLLCRRLQ